MLLSGTDGGIRVALISTLYGSRANEELPPQLAGSVVSGATPLAFPASPFLLAFPPFRVDMTLSVDLCKSSLRHVISAKGRRSRSLFKIGRPSTSCDAAFRVPGSVRCRFRVPEERVGRHGSGVFDTVGYSSDSVSHLWMDGGSCSTSAAPPGPSCIRGMWYNDSRDDRTTSVLR